MLCIANSSEPSKRGRLVRLALDHEDQLWQLPVGPSILDWLEQLSLVNEAVVQGEPWLEKQIPWVHWEREEGSRLKIMFVSHAGAGFKTLDFLSELVTQWLVPGRELPLISCQSMRFEIPLVSQRRLLYGEVVVTGFREKEFARFRENLEVLHDEVRLAARHNICATHLLQGRRLGLGRKNRDVHRATIRLTARRSTELTLTVLDELHRLLIFVGELFWNVRSARLLSRIAYSFVFLESKLAREELSLKEGGRVRLRLLAAYLSYPFGTKVATGVCLVMRMDPQYELLSEEHVAAAVQRVLPEGTLLSGSFLSMPGSCESVRRFYFEMDLQGAAFAASHRHRMSDSLPREIELSVEQLANAIFIQRNEEQILRGIIALCREVQGPNDLPIMMTESQGQEGSKLTFSVVLVRHFEETTAPLSLSFLRLPPGISYILEEERIVGSSSQGKKASSVFRISFDRRPFLRRNQSIDLQKAQGHVTQVIRSVLGDVRDFRGGIVDRRAEDLKTVRARLAPEEARHELLLENLFHALLPGVMQSYLPADTVYKNFQNVLSVLAGEGKLLHGYRVRSESVDGFLHIAVVGAEGKLAKMVLPVFSRLQLPSLSSAHAMFAVGEETVLSIVCRLADAARAESLLLSVYAALTNCERGVRNYQTLRVSIPSPVATLDPRVGTDRRTGVIMRMLFEGLMRMGRDGKVALAVAERVDISSDRKRYIFYLRCCSWSDGRAVTARDYEYSWKTALNPNFKAVRAFLFSPIKNAMAAKRGEVPLSEVGVYASSDRILEVELGKPTPYFLDLTSHWCFSPVPHGIDAREPEWAAYHRETILGNGPFRIEEWGPEAIRVVKNPLYWDARVVQLSAIEISVIPDPHAAWRAFAQGKLDWIGEPVSELPVDMLARLRAEGMLESVPIAAVDWYKLNTLQPPFSSCSMRRAFAFAVNRRQLIDETLLGDEEPAQSFLPSFLALAKKGLIRDGDTELAKRLFEEGLKELGLQREQLEPLVITHSSLQEDRATVEAAVRQWERCFNLKIELREIPWENYLSFMLSQDFQAASVTWYSWFNDPIYTLKHLKRRGKNANGTGWEHPRFIELLDRAEECLDLERRREALREAEELLLEEMPLIPISIQRHRFVKRPEVSGVCLTPLGQIDFLWAQIKPSAGEVASE